MSEPRKNVILLVISFLSILWTAPAQAQVPDDEWSQPYQLSSPFGRASEGYLVADQYGFVHCFWTETLFENQNTVVKYARFDGTTWTKPNDIYITGSDINNVSPFVDQQGILHIAWGEGLYGPAYYTYAPVNDAVSAKSWAQPYRIDRPARTVRLLVDSKGIVHLLYIDQLVEPGLYYVRSEDHGQTWSESLWLDPDILPDHVPDSLSFQIDEDDGLHATWFYGALDQSDPDWVRYIHSLDGGNTWSTPFLIDQRNEATNHNLTAPSPVMIVQGRAVHVIWAAGEQAYRHHRFSKDAGKTWTAPRRIFGDLNGQAFDGLALDSAGRVHFFGQIRYPQGIYHAYWDHNQWSHPSLIYLIALADSADGFGDRVHAHHTLPVVRAGNQLVLTFADGPADPNRRLFVIFRTLDDTPPLDDMPTPDSAVVSVPTVNLTSVQPTLIPESTVVVPSLESTGEQEGDISAPDRAIQVALVPTLFVLGITIIIQLLSRRKH